MVLATNGALLEANVVGHANLGEQNNVHPHRKAEGGVLEGDSVVISSADVPDPVAVRYAWAGTPDCNLYNKAGLQPLPSAPATGPSEPMDVK